MPKYPSGNNKMSASTSFVERVVYDAVSHSGLYVDVEQIDLRENRLYGKVDTKGEHVLLLPQKKLKDLGLLKEVDNTGESFMLSVFADAFIKLRESFNNLMGRGVITKDSLYVNLQPKRSLTFWQEDYSNHVMQISEGFMEYYKNNINRSDIKDFKSFVKSFTKYVAEKCPYTPFTLKSYMSSRFSDPLSTGFFIDLSIDDASDDSVKYINYINDPNYSEFVREAAYFGFIVDKHVPWRLVANPNSEYMKNEMQKKGFASLQEVFDKFYTNPETESFNMYVKMMMVIYEMLVLEEPQYLKVEKHETVTQVAREREVIRTRSISKIVKNIGEEMAIRLYAFVRIREKNAPMSQSEFDSLVKKSINFEKSIDLLTAIRYIEDKLEKKSPSRTKPSFRI